MRKRTNSIHSGRAAHTAAFRKLTDFSHVISRLRNEHGDPGRLLAEYHAVISGWSGPVRDGRSRWTFLETLRDWRNFIADYAVHLAAGVVEPELLAWNRADGGPVVDAAALRLPMLSPSPRLLMADRPPFVRHDAALPGFRGNGAWGVYPGPGPRNFHCMADSVPFIAEPESGTAQDAPKGESHHCGIPLISPDGTTIYASRRTQGTAGKSQPGSPTVCAFDARTGRELWNSHQTHKWFTLSIDGAQLAMVSQGQFNRSCVLQILDAAKGRCLQTHLVPFHYCEPFFHAGSGAVFLTIRGNLYRLDSVSGRMRCLARKVNGCGITPDGRRVFVMRSDGLWQFAVQTENWRRLLAVRNRRAAGFSPDGRQVILADERGISLVSVRTGKEWRRYTHRSGTALRACLSRDGSLLAAAFAERDEFRFWDTAVPSTPANRQSWDRRGISPKAISRQWKRGWNWTRQIPDSLRAFGRAAWFRRGPRPGTELWVFGSRHVCMRDRATGDLLRHASFSDETEDRVTGPDDILLSPDGTRLVLFSGNVWFIDIETLTALSVYETEKDVLESSRCIHGDWLYELHYCNSSQHHLCRWNLRTGAFDRWLAQLPFMELSISGLHLSDDLRHIVVTEYTGALHIFDAESGCRLTSTAMPRQPCTVTMSGDRLIIDGREWRLDRPDGSASIELNAASGRKRRR